MSYTLYDFTESLSVSGASKYGVKRVAAAWGVGRDYAEWQGGFLCELDDGRWMYVTGWCDTTGWGCQDGAEVHLFDARPSLGDLDAKDSEQHEWELEPADLNRYCRGEIDEHGRDVKQQREPTPIFAKVADADDEDLPPGIVPLVIPPEIAADPVTGGGGEFGGGGKRFSVKQAAEEMCRLAISQGITDAVIIEIRKRDKLRIT